MPALAQAALMIGRCLIGHAPGSNSEGWAPIATARLPAMGKEEFSIVLQVPPLVGIPAKVWDSCRNTKDG